MTDATHTKPTVKLTGDDGHAFAIMARCRRAMRGADWSKECQKAVLDEMKAGNYDELLAAVTRYFDVE